MLVDASPNMLREAKKRIPDAEAHYLFVLPTVFPGILQGRKFSIITANALFVHIPPDRAPGVLKAIRPLLTDEGVFFVNFKINDHSLISSDGRYFAYYRDATMPEAMLRNAGFVIDEIALRSSERTMYGSMRRIQWANFYCRCPA